jgi:diphosphomevalonate decarboxylase
MSMKTARASAHSNIALCKYWGKREGATPGLNLPATGSLSLTLDALYTQTEVAPGADDRFELDGRHLVDDAARKVFAHLDRLWNAAGRSGTRPHALVRSTNHLPTAAGLASSASGFAALTLAGMAAFGGALDRGPLSALARMGSGSAARSLWGGFVRLDRGNRPDGADCVARPLFAQDHWDVRLVVVQTTKGSKPIGSTAGMERSRTTSPFYAPWVEASEADLDRAEAALAVRDMSALGAIVEHSCFKMHACMLASSPPFSYWNGTTMEVVRAVWSERAAGLEGYATIDAGPHVKVFCAAADAPKWAERLGSMPGVLAVQTCAPGPDAHVEVVG